MKRYFSLVFLFLLTLLALSACHNTPSPEGSTTPPPPDEGSVETEGALSFAGVAAATEGEAALRFLFSVDTEKMQEIHGPYSIRVGVITAVASSYFDNLLQSPSDCKIKVASDGSLVTEAENATVHDIYAEGRAGCTLGDFEARVSFSDLQDPTDTRHYETQYVARAFYILTSRTTGKSRTYYVNATHTDFVHKDSVSLYEVAKRTAENESAPPDRLQALITSVEAPKENKDMTVFEYFGKYIDPVTCPREMTLQSSVRIPGSGEVPDVILNHFLVTLDVQNTKFSLAVAYPDLTIPTELPAVMLIHGAAQSLDNYTTAAIYLAQSGYVAMAHDQPAITNSKLEVTGTDGDFRKENLRYADSADPMDCTLSAAVAAGLTAFHILQSGDGLVDEFGVRSRRVHVDQERMGITGISWGGWSSSILGVLLGNQVKAIAPKYLCGNNHLNYAKPDLDRLSPEARATWQKFFDPGTYAGLLRATLLLEDATNDTFGYPAALNKFYTEAKNGRAPAVYFTTVPNEDHYISNRNPDAALHKGILGGVGYIVPHTTAFPEGVRCAAGTKYLEMIHNELAYFDWILKGKEPAPNICTIRSAKKEDSAVITVVFTVTTSESAPAPDAVKLFYAPKAGLWQTKKWQYVTPTKEGTETASDGRYTHTYTAVIPKDSAASDVAFFAYAENASLGSTGGSCIHEMNVTTGAYSLVGGYPAE